MPRLRDKAASHDVSSKEAREQVFAAHAVYQLKPLARPLFAPGDAFYLADRGLVVALVSSS